MKFYCDLHIHSRYSRATSSGLTVRSLAEGAVRKGIAVLGTGDFTHPAWMEELERELEEAEPGLYRLKDGSSPTRFMLTSEISTIYKQDGRVRKVHHLVGAPDIAAAKRISARLAAVGNILSDGRPILGITSRNLLEIVLASSEDAFVVPAHIWTPWFSALGSKSGFDSIAECYLDLDPYVFAVETGLSSDPPMNWMVKGLDRYHLISCSDAHSADKLGREATIFDVDLDYHALRRAMATGPGLVGTVEFFPEEGKYHLDGHRDCGVVLEPEKTRELSGLCPVCGRALTVGVLHRVEELAERPEGERPESARPFFSLIPLAELIAEILQVSSPTKKVMEVHQRLTSRLGGELPLLLDIDPEEIERFAGETLALAVRRMRAGEVRKEAGYDGMFGRIRVFADNERDMLFAKGIEGVPPRRRRAAHLKDAAGPIPDGRASLDLNPEQERAAAWREGPLAVIAGPGTGKTRVLVERTRRLLQSGSTGILAVTFTVRAAREIAQRLGESPADVCTFHSLAARIMHGAGMDFEIADEAMLEEIARPAVEGDAGPWVADLVFRQATAQALTREQEGFMGVLRSRGVYTYDGLIEEVTRLVEAGRFTPAWDHVMVDEFQDINPVQYAFLKTLVRGVGSAMVIGDPNQAIYGFRGSSAASFDDFGKDNPSCTTIRLQETYRLHDQLAHASNAFIGSAMVKSVKGGKPVRIMSTDRPYAFLAREIESLCGGLSHRTVGRVQAEFALSDMAVIVRTRSQASPVIDALARSGIPCDTAYARPLAETVGVRERIALLEGADLSGTVVQRIAAMEASSRSRLPDLDQGHAFYRYAHLFGDDVAGFVELLRLSSDQAGLGGERVHVITAHAAKGLEFGCVFVAGLSRGMFPLQGADEREERNLFYVAMTRARDLLYLVCPPQAASGFVEGIPSGCTARTVERPKTDAPGQMSLFE
jgi:DNA helicase-2/ATP-dependent DNA helicase PcrA